MRRTGTHVLLATIAAVVSWGILSPPVVGAAERPTRLVIICFDGARTIADSTQAPFAEIQTLAFHLCNELKPQGSWVQIEIDPWQCSATHTIDGNAAANTGMCWLSQDVSGDTRSPNPFLWEYASRDLGWTWHICSGKHRLYKFDHGEPFGSSFAASFSEILHPWYPGMDGNDGDVFAYVTADIAASHPEGVFIDYAETDRNGHREWDYFGTVPQTDSYVKQTVDFFEADPFYQDRTAYLIYGDHSRHCDGVYFGVRDHGDDCACCRLVYALLIGSCFKTGYETTGRQIDLAPTLAAAVGVTMGDVEGTVLTDVFDASFTDVSAGRAVPSAWGAVKSLFR